MPFYEHVFLARQDLTTAQVEVLMEGFTKILADGKGKVHNHEYWGLRTLALRLGQHQDSALHIAHWLAVQPEVARVLHPGLPTDPGHAIWRRDFAGASGLFGFVLNGGDEAARAALIDGLGLFGIGYSWGGYESLALPVDPQNYRTATRWAAEGPVIRLSIGLEHADDLIADLAEGLARFRRVRDGQ
jgi:cystathionine beta-lyase